MRRVVFPSIMVFQIVNLCVAVVARCQAVISPGFHDLVKLTFAVISPGIGKSGLQETPAAAATVIVRSVGVHINKIFFTHHRFHNESHVFRHRIAEALSYQLAWILYRELYLQVLVPVGIHFQLSFPNPLGIVLNDTFALKIVLNVESLQSDPDCKKFVPSLCIEPDLAFEVIHRFGLDPDDFLPVLQVRTEETVVFRSPSLGAICPVCPYKM
jgi:hypothetical protein